MPEQFIRIGYAARLNLHTLHSQRAEPIGYHQRRQRAQHILACHCFYFLSQPSVKAYKRFREGYQSLRYMTASAIGHTRIAYTHHMENYIGICRVFLMVMAEPVGRPHMHLDVAAPFHTIYPQPGTGEVRPGIRIMTAWTQYLNPAPVDSAQICTRETIFPYVLI
jgi:hypothetical protein